MATSSGTSKSLISLRASGVISRDQLFKHTPSRSGIKHLAAGVAARACLGLFCGTTAPHHGDTQP